MSIRLLKISIFVLSGLAIVNTAHASGSYTGFVKPPSEKKKSQSDSSKQQKKHKGDTAKQN